MLEFISQPWPWYVGGPLIGLMVPALLLIGGKQFGISDNMRHLCAAFFPGRAEFLKYDWRQVGSWNLIFAVGIILGGAISFLWLGGVGETNLAEATRVDLEALGLGPAEGAVPLELFTWKSLATVPGFIVLIGGGFLVGFGARYGGGCTSGHAISGLADLQLPSLIAVFGLFAGGLIAANFILPLLLQ